MSPKKVSVTLTYASLGAQPPIFLAGSFSEPAWHPQEMDFTTDENGEHVFHKEVDVDEGGQFQYKFRIGLGDWWALNEQAPSVTDNLGNRNNLLAVPTTEEVVKKSSTSESTFATPVSDTPVPELAVEKVDDEPRHGDDFGLGATAGQKDAHDMRAVDAEPDHVMIRSDTSTPVYANTAAEVADSAATLDREPSPIPVSDEEAGRTGERRMSRTPIPQVALTAAEVADVAAILDQGDHDDMEMNFSQFQYPYDTPSGPTTPWSERAPLFAHECFGLSDGVEGSPITSDSIESPTKPEPKEEVIDLNDPLLEPFPEDRLSILTQIRSCESRMSEDETYVHGLPVSPVAKPKSLSPSIDTPSSARIDAPPSLVLDVIEEEKHESESYFSGLLAPGQNMQGVREVRVPEELNVIDEGEEPMEEPKTVLDNLKKIEEAIGDPNKTTVKGETIKPVGVEGRMPVEGSGMAEKPNMTNKSIEQMKEFTEIKESPKLEARNNEADDSQIGVIGIEAPTDSNRRGVREGHQADLEEISAPEQFHDVGNLVFKHQSEHGHIPQLPEEPMNEFTENENPNEVSKEAVEALWKAGIQPDDKHLQFLEEEPHDVEEPRQMEEPTQTSDPQQAGQFQLDKVSSISMGGTAVKDLPAERTIEVRDVEQASSSKGLTPEHDVLGSEGHKSAIALKNPKPEAETFAEINPLISKIKVNEETPPTHEQSAASNTNDAEEVTEMLTNGVDTALSTSVDGPSANGHDKESKLSPRNTSNLERPLTPSSDRSPMKVPEPQNIFQAIWRTVFVGWIGGLFAQLCGGGRGPLLAISGVIIIGPALAMYFYQPRAL